MTLRILRGNHMIHKKGVFRTLKNIYDAAFLQKLLTI